MTNKEYLEIKNVKIPVVIRNYKNSKSVKIYFKEDTMYINKSAYCSKEEMLKIIHENKDKIYNEYMKIKESINEYIRTWNTGDIFMYAGEEYIIERILKSENDTFIKVRFNYEEKKLEIYVPSNEIEEEILNETIKKCIKDILRTNLRGVIFARLEYFSKIMGIEYNSFRITDAVTRYGSCVPKKKNLNFTLRLMMLDTEKIDAIVVHELSHIVHQNHSKEFYELVEKYIPNYKEIDNWLKENSSKMIL